MGLFLQNSVVVDSPNQCMSFDAVNSLFFTSIVPPVTVLKIPSEYQKLKQLDQNYLFYLASKFLGKQD